MRSRSRLGLLAVLAAIAVTATFGHAAARDAATPQVERGRHLATALAGCADCHGSSFDGGRAFTRGVRTVYAANLTGGAGGVAAYTDADLKRAIRQGVAPDGTPLQVMPSSEYAVMTDDDVDALAAFLRSLPPVDRTVPRPPVPAEPPGHEPPVTDAPPSQPLSGGAYLARIGGCTGCHAANLAGGRRFGALAAPNISHAGLGTWTFADFETAMRTGKTPAGHVLSSVMPWSSVGKMTDDELRTLYDFLESQSGS